jgi:predicted membrane channel-forming protein YqfA (hemolysin III family)
LALFEVFVLVASLLPSAVILAPWFLCLVGVLFPYCCWRVMDQNEHKKKDKLQLAIFVVSGGRILLCFIYSRNSTASVYVLFFLLKTAECCACGSAAVI